MDIDEKLGMYVEAADRYVDEDLIRNEAEKNTADQERKELEDIVDIEDRNENVLYKRCLERLENADKKIENTKRAAKYSIEQVIAILKEKNRELEENYINKTPGQIQLEINRLKTENQGLESDIIHKGQLIKKTQELINKYIEIGDTERKTELERELSKLNLEVNEKKEKYQINIDKLNTCEKYEEQYKENSKMIKKYREKAKTHEIELEDDVIAPTVDQQGAPTVDQQGATTVDPKGAPTVDQQGAPTVDQQGAPTVDPKGAPTVDQQGAPTVDQQGATTVDPKGAPTVDPKGAPTVQPRNIDVRPIDRKKIIINAETGFAIWDEMKSGVHINDKIDLDKIFNDKKLRKSVIKILDKDKDQKYIKILKSRIRSMKLNPAILAILKEQGTVKDLKKYIDVVFDKEKGVKDLPFEYEANLASPAYIMKEKTISRLNRALLRDNKELGTDFPATKFLGIKKFLSKMPLLTKSTKSWIGLLPKTRIANTKKEKSTVTVGKYQEYIENKYRDNPEQRKTSKGYKDFVRSQEEYAKSTDAGSAFRKQLDANNPIYDKSRVVDEKSQRKLEKHRERNSDGINRED